MRSKKINLTELLRSGLSQTDGTTPGLAMLKNLRTDGQKLVGLPTETTQIGDSRIPFSLGTVDGYIKSSGIWYNTSGTPISVLALTGAVKVVNLTKVLWIQDSVATYFLDSQGLHRVNPGGVDIPLVNTITQMNGQILVGGFLTDYNQLDKSYIGWSDIGSECFDLTRENTAGFYNPNIGEILNILPLQDNAIVLGSRGAAQMYYAGHVFGFRDLDIPLLKSKDLCASSTNQVIYVSKDGELIKVDKNGNFENLNFGWIGSDVVAVKYVNGRNWFVFTTASNSYILDSKGMFSYGHIIWGEYASGMLAVNTGFEQLSWEFRTNFMDGESAGLKHLFEIAITDGLTYPGSCIAYSEGISKTQGYKSLNSLNACKYPLAGQLISVGYRAAEKPKISYFAIEISKIDRRFGFGSTPYQGAS